MWTPSIKRGRIGRDAGSRQSLDVDRQPFAQDAGLQRRGGGRYASGVDVPADDPGRSARYVNPHGFTGLKGFDLDRPNREKRFQYRQPRAGSGLVMSRKGDPFDATS